MNWCDCLEDGFCHRYQRDMGGRFRELCRGINVDAGTAAAFREQWGRDVARVSGGGPPIPLLLKTDQMPGDAVVMTAAVYSLHKAHPGKYLTAVESRWPEVFSHNPDVVQPSLDMTPLQMHYPAIHRCNERGIHFMQGWCEFLGVALGVSIPLLTNRPHLYFPNPDPLTEDFWVVCSGGKDDFTCKLWGHENYQQVVSSLKGAVRFIQVGTESRHLVGGAGTVRDSHPRLCGAEDMVGKTTLRGLFDVIRRAKGVLCGVSLPMHVAAALGKPCVCIAGGREPVQWNAYSRQTYVHTVGVLPCHSVQGHVGQACWRSRVVPLGDGSWYDQDTCERPVDGLPQCMRIISPAEVAGLVLRYNVGAT